MSSFFHKPSTIPHPSSNRERERAFELFLWFLRIYPLTITGTADLLCVNLIFFSKTNKKDKQEATTDTLNVNENINKNTWIYKSCILLVKCLHVSDYMTWQLHFNSNFMFYIQFHFLSFFVCLLLLICFYFTFCSVFFYISLHSIYGLLCVCVLKYHLYREWERQINQQIQSVYYTNNKQRTVLFLRVLFPLGCGTD